MRTFITIATLKYLGVSSEEPKVVALFIMLLIIGAFAEDVKAMFK